jgi:ornithine decarboxylase
MTIKEPCFMQFDQLPLLLREKLNAALKDPSLQTPYILCSPDLLKFNLDFFREHIPVDKIFFPVKVNHDHKVLQAIARYGSSFEIASQGELKLLKNIGVESTEIIFSNPVRISSHTKAAFDAGIRTFAIDRISELERLAKNAPGSKVYVRLAVPNEGAEWKLDQKYGATERECLDLMGKAEAMGMKPCGLSFHVGWNNRNLQTWKNAVIHSVDVAEKAVKKGFLIEFINIGGGFPAHNNDQYAELNRISEAISPLLTGASERLGMQIWAEPGSFICANSSVLVTRIIDVARRFRKNRVWIDAGVFQGFYWRLSGIRYHVFSANERIRKMNRWVVTGPTCDSQDVFEHSAALPADMKEGDTLLVFPAGAYINSAREYNGFGYPANI